MVNEKYADLFDSLYSSCGQARCVQLRDIRQRCATDPTENGGLFVGRRPGTAPVRFRALPKRGSDARQRMDGSLASLLLAR